MILAIDVHYRADKAKAVGVLFNWHDSLPENTIVTFVDEVAEYVAGEFYKRELPCILKLIEQVDLKHIDAIVIDGYVFIDNNLNFGLGGRLWQTLGKTTPVIGVAKTSFLKNKETVIEIKRGESKNPLFISSIGIELNLAVTLITQMKGSFRLPDILKSLDTKTREDY